MDDLQAQEEANAFLERLYTEQSILSRELERGEDSHLDTSALPWLADGAVLTSNERPGDYDVASNNPIAVIHEEMVRNFDFLRDHEAAAKAAESLTQRLATPIRHMLDELEQQEAAHGLDTAPRIIPEHRLLSVTTSDFLTDFAGRLWDIAPMHSMGWFAVQMVQARQDIQAAAHRVATNNTVEMHAEREDPTLAAEFLQAAADPEHPPLTPSWLTNERNARTLYDWYQDTIGVPATAHYAHLTAARYCAHISAGIQERLKHLYNREREEGREQAMAWRQRRELDQILTRMQESLKRTAPEGFVRAVAEVRTLTARNGG